MPSIQATRQEISDRFSVLGFNVRTNGHRWFEVVLGTEPDLFRDQSKRTPRNFYSSRAHGPLLAERGESVYLVPPEVMRRFAGQARLYYGLATFADANYSEPNVLQVPSQESPWVSIKAYSGKVARRMLALGPNRREGSNGDGYGVIDPSELTWAGDSAQPGIEKGANGHVNGNGNGNGHGHGHGNGNGHGMPAISGKTNEAAPSASAGFSYNDGLGPMPAPPRSARGLDSPAGDVGGEIAGAVLSRVVDNKGDIKWELDQLKGLKHPHNNPAMAGNSQYQTTTTNIRGPQIENLVTDQISADFEIRWQYNGKSLGNIEITNTGTNDAVGWGLDVKANISDDANVHNGRAAVNVRFYFRFTRVIGSDQIGIFDLKLYGDGTFDQNFRWTQSSSLAQGGRPTGRQFAAPVVVPIAAAIVGTVMTRILNNEGDIKWELDQLKGLKHPNNDANQAGPPTYQTTTTTITGPQIENLVTDQISADFEIRWQYNGKSLGNIEITNTGTNDAVGWGLDVKANVSDDANVHNGRAAVNVRFYFRFTRVIGSDQIGIFDLKLYGDGTFDQNFRWTQSSSLAQGGRPTGRQFAAPVVVPIAAAIVGTVMTRILNNEGDIKWELDQLKGLKHPSNDPNQAGPSTYQTTTTTITGPQIENLVTDQISADFEIRWQYNGKSLGNIEITNTGTNDAVGWGLDVKANISDDANVHNGRAAVNVRFYFRFTRVIGSDQIGIFDLKLYGDGTFDQNFRWTQSSSLAQGGHPTGRQFAAPVVVPIAAAIVGTVMTRILNNEGDIKWELDQLKGLKHPNNDANQAGPPTYQATTTTITGPQIENLVTDQISADFEIRWQYNGKSLGNIEITNTGTNDAVGWGLDVKANISDDANVHNGCAAVNVRFYYRFTRVIGSDQIGIFDLKLYGDGTFDQNFRWTQSSSLAQGGRPTGRQFAAPVVVPIAAAIVGTVMTRILNNEGDIKWELDQLKGLKHPNNDANQAGPPTYQTTTTTITGPQIENLVTDQISADFEIRWQYNGKSLGNIEITNIGTNDAVGWGLDVKANISDDANVHSGRAAVNVRFYFRFTRVIGSDQIGIFDLKLYGDGTFDQNFRWTQSSSLAQGGRPTGRQFAAPVVVPIAAAIVGTVMTRILNNEGDIKWELDQLKGLKHPNNDANQAGPPTYQTTTTTITGPQIENLVTDQISADFEIRWQYNGKSLGNIEITNTGTNDAVGWGLDVKANISDDANVHNGRAVVNVRFYYRFTRVIGSDQIGIFDLKLYGDGTFDQNFRWTQSSSFALATPGSRKNGDAMQLAPAPNRIARSRALTGAEVAIAIGGVFLDRIANNEGDVSWELDQFRGIKHPNDTAPSPAAPFRDAPTIRLSDWPKAGGVLDEISANFTVDWQFNGRSLGNVRIANVGVNDSIGWGLRVQAQIMDDNILYPPTNCAALRIRFHFRFTRSIGSDVIAVIDLHLYGNGTYERDNRWEQASALAMA